MHVRAAREIILRIRVPRGRESKRKTEATKGQPPPHQQELRQTCLHVQRHASKDTRRVCERGKKEASVRRGLETKEAAKESPVARRQTTQPTVRPANVLRLHRNACPLHKVWTTAAIEGSALERSFHDVRSLRRTAGRLSQSDTSGRNFGNATNMQATCVGRARC
mmetsp:Transcript_10234/g.62489  ORF Transcript_10234/g.62489 Transcript_10234/m.62489 type:complete len:165 (+) Transcript_10234:4722-5216(+)